MAAKPKLGDQRYLATWCDAENLNIAAQENGWNPESDVGPLDYVDPADHELAHHLPDFEAAVKFAREKIAADFWGCPRVYLQEFGPDDVPPLAREWEDVKFWDVEAEGPPVEYAA